MVCFWVTFRDFNYINSKETGSQKLWYETGKIKANYEVINGERFGLIGLKKMLSSYGWK